MSTVGRWVLPGFSLSLGYTVFYLSVLVLIPLSACFFKAASLSWDGFWEAVWSDRTRPAYALTFGASFAAAALNAFLGLLVAWVLVRYSFPLKRLFDALVDLPFALPTAVAGLVYSGLYAENGWLGQFLVPLGIEGAYSRLGIIMVLTFTGFPFVVRTVQPVLESFEADVEEAAAILGANRWQTFRRILFPALLPSVLTGFALSFARALGEYGAVVFIASGDRSTTIAPVLIVETLESFNYAEASAISVVLLLISFTMLGFINLLERWSRRYGA